MKLAKLEKKKGCLWAAGKLYAATIEALLDGGPENRVREGGRFDDCFFP